MLHLPPLIEDLALILAAAGVVTLLFRRFHQPTVLGYIIAGFLVGPYFPFFPTIGDAANVRIWADIGVIFLLFALGLEFSFKKLIRVGGAASLTATVEVLAMATIGFATGKLFGWNNMDSLFLGGILSISSTTIIIRAFEEVGVKGRGFVGLVFGVLIVEDLIAILLLVLLSTIAISQTVAGTEMLLAIIKLIFFLILWFLAGVFLLPTILKRLRPLLTEETLLVVSLGLCFVMVYLTTHAGFSPALGAFIMGSLLAETTEGKRIEHTIKSVKDLFAAIFFVSVGMLIDPQVLARFAVPIAVITIVTILGKALSTAIGVILSGKSLRHAVQSGLSLAQIGEFSFIIAGLGLTLKVTSDFLYPVAVGVSAVTTFTTPYMIKSADRIYVHLEAALPTKWLQILAAYNQAANNISFVSESWTLLKAYSLRVITNAVLASTIFIGSSRFLLPELHARINNEKLVNAIGIAIALICSAPFFWAMVKGRSKQESVQKILRDGEKRSAVFLFEISRWLIAIGLFMVLATQFVAITVAAGLSLGVVVLLLFIFSRRLEGIYGRIEGQFVKNLLAREHESQMPPLAPWDAHLASLEIHPTAELVGKTLEQLRIRERFGITVALIERGGKRLPAPNRNEMLFPNDKIFVIGTDEQIYKFSSQVERTLDSRHIENNDFNYSLISYRINPGSPYSNNSIRESGIREKSHGLIVGIERRGKRILNPDSTMLIEDSDLLWIVGERNALRDL